MPIPKCFDFEDYNQYPGEDNPTTDAEIQDYFKNQNTLVKSLASRMWQPGTVYEVDDVIFSPNLPKGVQAVCVQAGTSDANVEPSWNAELEALTPDGSVYWRTDPVTPPIMKGATAEKAGKAGQVPTPEAGATNKVLFGDGTWKILLELVYPVGSLYWSANNTEPSKLFGGTWERVKDKFILAAGDSYEAGSTGGEASHTLTTDEMPSHNHGGSAASGTITDHIHATGRGTTNNTGYNISTNNKNINCTLDEQASYQQYWNGSGSSCAFSSVGTEAGAYAANHFTSKAIAASSGTAGSHSHSISIDDAGGGAAHNNMPPYETYYCWKRTA